MTSVELTANWFMGLDIDQLSAWVAQIEMNDFEWDILITSFFSNPILQFVKEEDAVAFKLRFGEYVSK